ncbi:heavy-metal-associated domain-containing protein [Kitasatospora sp. NPDC101183]|uniref:heavy-metal-associated domain-containing protein n=1 Tax=Kitasatospora sp. NPDC101183 TaxID=3364100 RepID=UPI003830F847
MSVTTTVTTVLAVEGMSCGHCERTVSTGLAALPGVTGVTADAPSGRVTVASARPLEDEALREVVDGAGFTFVGRL